MQSADTEPWIEAALSGIGRSVVVGIVGVQGSSPREVGARMTVGPEAVAGSIGGGMLEYMAIQQARALLKRRAVAHRLISFPLGPDTQQCCGGVVTLFFEPVTDALGPPLRELAAHMESGALIATRLGNGRKQVVAGDDGTSGGGSENDAWLEDREDGTWLCESIRRRRFVVALFGAGHVGQALVAALAPLRCRVLWFDPRADQFPAEIPANAEARITEEPATAVDRLPPGALVVVMTHRHPLDYEICREALRRDDLAWVGLIGSASKKNRFKAAMRREGLDDAVVERLVCPIGIPTIRGKEPPVIAASVVAQLLEIAEAREAETGKRQGITEKEADATPVADVFGG